MKNFLLSIALLSGSAAAVEPSLSTSLIDAVAKKMGKTPAEVRQSISGDKCERKVDNMLGCAIVYLHANEIRMNAQFSRAQIRLPHAKDREKLARAQRAWITFRNASCDYEERAHEGSSLYALKEINCHSMMSEARTSTLREYADCGTDAC